MRRIEIHKLCDACNSEGAENDATVTVGLVLSPATKPKLLDLCDKHNEALIAPVRELLDSHGADPEDNGHIEAPAKKDVWPCPRCSKSSVSRRVLIDHLVSIHGVERVAASHEAPTRNPAIPCEVCGYVSDGPQGAARHLKGHGEQQPAQLTITEQPDKPAAKRSHRRRTTEGAT